jgi:hypothetical protein
MSAWVQSCWLSNVVSWLFSRNVLSNHPHATILNPIIIHLWISPLYIAKIFACTDYKKHYQCCIKILEHASIMYMDISKNQICLDMSMNKSNQQSASKVELVKDIQLSLQ